MDNVHRQQPTRPGVTLAAASAALLLTLATSPAARAVVITTEYGQQYSTIGDPGNPVVPESVGPLLYFGPDPLLIGAVDYEYRIARTETTVVQWHEFITAYRPFYTAGNPNFAGFTSLRISWSASQNQYVYNPAHAQTAAEYMEWRVAARYANWLHNGKVNQAWAFEAGAYDTSTFGENPDGTITDQREHSPGARFWIPSLDEWTKAMHWDPDHDGPGEGGYWLYPTGSDAPPITGVPGAGQTSGGLPTNHPPFPVGSYSDVQSPWGLLDGSGSAREWTETIVLDRYRFVRGSKIGVDVFDDRVDRVNSFLPWNGGMGFRLAAVIPGASVCSPLLIVLGWTVRKGRRR